MAFRIEKDWITQAGLRAVVVVVQRQDLSDRHRCGYVGVDKDSKFFNTHYDEMDIDCHGGLTFSSEVKENYPVKSELHWFGFDCAHFGDAEITEDPFLKTTGCYSIYPNSGVVRDLAYCEAQCEHIAAQIKSQESTHSGD